MYPRSSAQLGSRDPPAHEQGCSLLGRVTYPLSTLQAALSTSLALLQVQAAGPGVLQKLGRVLKEKALGDFDRVFQGTSKTREKLGVRSFAMHLLLSLSCRAQSSSLQN